MSIGISPNNMSILQLKAMLLGKGASFPLESPYTRILKQLERIGIVIKNEHNQFFRNPLKKGGKVRAVGMQTVYTITKVTKMNNHLWYSLENAVGHKLPARKASDLKAVS